MATSIVRLKETKQLIGLYAHEGTRELFILVDQLTSPFNCEFMTVEFGGLHFAKGTAVIDRQEWNEEEEYEDPVYDGATMDEYLFMRVDDDEWQDFRDSDGCFHEARS